MLNLAFKLPPHSIRNQLSSFSITDCHKRTLSQPPLNQSNYHLCRTFLLLDVCNFLCVLLGFGIPPMPPPSNPQFIYGKYTLFQILV